MQNVLITGAAGFIGSNFVHYWLEKYPDHNVTILDALTYAGNKHNLADLSGNSKLNLVVGSICDDDLVKKLLDRANIDTIIHFAAESHVDRSITEPDAFIDTNI